MKRLMTSMMRDLPNAQADLRLEPAHSYRSRRVVWALQATFYRPWLVLALIVGLLGSMVVDQTPIAHAASSYYVDNATGSNCSDTGAHSSSQPWCTLTPVSNTTFVPGDQILLARGDTWTQSVTLHGSGNPAAGGYITLDAYGSGANPHIKGTDNGVDRTLNMPDLSYWNVSNLELSNAASGVYITYSTINHQGLNFNNLNIHDIVSSIAQSGDVGRPFVVEGNPTLSSSQYALSGLTIANVTMTNNVQVGITFQLGQASGGGQGQFSFVQPNMLQNVVIKNCDTENTPYPGLAIINVSHIAIIDTVIRNTNTMSEPQGTTGVFAEQDADVTFANDMILNTPVTYCGAQPCTDEPGIDTEAYSDQFKYHGNYIAGNAGAGLEFLALGLQGDYNTNHEVSSNAFSGNGVAGNRYKSSLFFTRASGTSPFSGTAHDNLYYEPTGFMTGDFSNWTITNNLSATSASQLYDAPRDYSATQGGNHWSYQYFDGSTWANLGFDTVNQRYGTTGFISQFDENPDPHSSYWIARAWTAPSSGQISVRGRVLKNDIAGGDGVKVRITRNGTQLWPVSGGPQTVTFNDQSGYDTDVNLAVAVNDIIRFEINNGSNGDSSHDVTSWTPSIAYVLGTNTVNDTDAGLSYSGSGWTAQSGQSGYYSSDFHSDATNGDSVSYTFTGTGVSYISSRNVDRGNVDVYVDNVYQGRVSAYSASSQPQQVLYSIAGLPQGSHTLKLVKVDGSYIVLDALTITQ